jgi:hypothetical protein
MQTNYSTPLLDNLIIAAPCQVPWSSMAGTDRARDCSHCSRKVYNLSDMNRSEAEAFLAENGTSHCATFYRRADGTIMTDDCPAGLRKLRDRYRAMVRIACSLVAFFLALPGALAQNRSDSRTTTTKQTTKESQLVAGYIRVLSTPLTETLKVNDERHFQTLGMPAWTVKRADRPLVVLPGKNGLPDDGATLGSGTIHLRAEKGIGPDSRAYHQYLQAISNEDSGKHLVAVAGYKDALRTMTESALNNLNENQAAYDPHLKQAIEEHLLRLQNVLGLGSQDGTAAEFNSCEEAAENWQNQQPTGTPAATSSAKPAEFVKEVWPNQTQTEKDGDEAN